MTAASPPHRPPTTKHAPTIKKTTAQTCENPLVDGLYRRLARDGGTGAP